MRVLLDCVHLHRSLWSVKRSKSGIECQLQMKKKANIWFVTENVTLDISDSAQRVVSAAPPPLCETKHSLHSGKWRNKMTDLWQPTGWSQKKGQLESEVFRAHRGWTATVFFFFLFKLLLVSRLGEPQMDLKRSHENFFLFWCFLMFNQAVQFHSAARN